MSRARPARNDAGPPRPSPVKRRAGTVSKFEKTGPTALLGHLDLIRALPRVMRRIDLPIAYSQGFHPKPDMSFSPALSLGVLSLAEFVDIKFRADFDPRAFLDVMNEAAPEGLQFVDGVALGPDDPGITKIISGARYLFAIARPVLNEHGGEAWLSAQIRALLASGEHKVRREIEKLARYVDVRPS